MKKYIFFIIVVLTASLPAFSQISQKKYDVDSLILTQKKYDTLIVLQIKLIGRSLSDEMYEPDKPDTLLKKRLIGNPNSPVSESFQ